MPGPPPPPPPPTLCAPAAGQDVRGNLLQSIRAGKTLKKTVTVDKSAPVIAGKLRDEPSAAVRPYRGLPGGSSSALGSAPIAATPNLSSLFSGGMPKLKSTGLRQNIVDKPESGSAPTKRGPPPIPPPATQKPSISVEPATAPSSSAPSKGFGKPMLAPKPPPTPLGTSTQKPSPPPKKLNFPGGPSVSRAQSMRLPRSPPVLAPTPTSLHQSQDCLNEAPQPPRPAINRVLRPPIARPPSPPTSKSPQVATTRVAPPPPSRLPVTAPSMPPPPPPPPFRSTSIHQRLAPPPPPTPPARLASSASNSSSSTSSSPSFPSSAAFPPRNGQPMFNYDLELRFAEKFHSISNFPNPSPFRGFPKVYNSKNAAKQQAPAPPLQSTSAPGTMLRLNASSGGKQHNAASSAC